MHLSLKYYRTSRLISTIVFLTGAISVCAGLIKALPSFIPPLSVTAIISGLLFLYDRKLWSRFPFLVDTKDISGRYEGKLISEYKENGVPREVTVAIEIFQTASVISVRQFNNDGKTVTQSQSSLAELEVRPDANPRLRFSYGNEGDAVQSPKTAHLGFCILDWSNDRKVVNGTYFTNRNPKCTRGEIAAKFQTKRLKGGL